MEVLTSIGTAGSVGTVSSGEFPPQPDNIPVNSKLRIRRNASNLIFIGAHLLDIYSKILSYRRYIVKKIVVFDK